MGPHTADYCPANLAVATASRASVRPTPTRSRLCATAAYEAISSLEYSAPVVCHQLLSAMRGVFAQTCKQLSAAEKRGAPLNNLPGRLPRRPTLAHDRTSQRLDGSRAPHLTPASAVAKFLCKTKKWQSEVVARQVKRKGGG